MVNKDVGGVPGEGDELSFLLTPDGQIIYSKNCRQLAVLMHVDISMPLWVFFDVYGGGGVECFVNLLRCPVALILRM